MPTLQLTGGPVRHVRVTPLTHGRLARAAAAALAGAFALAGCQQQPPAPLPAATGGLNPVLDAPRNPFFDPFNHLFDEGRKKKADDAVGEFEKFTAGQGGLADRLQRNLEAQRALAATVSEARLRVFDQEFAALTTHVTWAQLRDRLVDQFIRVDDERARFDLVKTAAPSVDPHDREEAYRRAYARLDERVTFRASKVELVSQLLALSADVHAALGELATERAARARQNFDAAAKATTQPAVKPFPVPAATDASSGGTPAGDQPTPTAAQAAAAADKKAESDQKAADELRAARGRWLVEVLKAIGDASRGLRDDARLRAYATVAQRELLDAIKASRDGDVAAALVPVIGSGLGREDFVLLEAFTGEVRTLPDGAAAAGRGLSLLDRLAAIPFCPEQAPEVVEAEKVKFLTTVIKVRMAVYKARVAARGAQAATLCELLGYLADPAGVPEPVAWELDLVPGVARSNSDPKGAAQTALDRLRTDIDADTARLKVLKSYLSDSAKLKKATCDQIMRDVEPEPGGGVPVTGRADAARPPESGTRRSVLPGEHVRTPAAAVGRLTARRLDALAGTARPRPAANEPISWSSLAEQSKAALAARPAPPKGQNADPATKIAAQARRRTPMAVVFTYAFAAPVAEALADDGAAAPSGAGVTLRAARQRNAAVAATARNAAAAVDTAAPGAGKPVPAEKFTVDDLTKWAGLPDIEVTPAAIEGLITGNTAIMGAVGRAVGGIDAGTWQGIADRINNALKQGRLAHERLARFVNDLVQVQLDVAAEDGRHVQKLLAIAQAEHKRWALVRTLFCEIAHEYGDPGPSDVAREELRKIGIDPALPRAALVDCSHPDHEDLSRPETVRLFQFAQVGRPGDQPQGDAPAGHAHVAAAAAAATAPAPGAATRPAAAPPEGFGLRAAQRTKLGITTNGPGVANAPHPNATETVWSGLQAGDSTGIHPDVTLDRDVLVSLRQLAQTATFWHKAESARLDHDGWQLRVANERLFRGVRLVSGHLLVIAANAHAAEENVLQLSTELAQHDLRLDSLEASVYEARQRMALGDIQAFHATGITQADFDFVISNVMRGLIAYRVRH